MKLNFYRLFYPTLMLRTGKEKMKKLKIKGRKEMYFVLVIIKMFVIQTNQAKEKYEVLFNVIMNNVCLKSLSWYIILLLL